MKDCKVFVGLDYHQASVQLCVLASDGEVLCNRSLPNEAAVLVTVAEQFGEVADVAIESCSGAPASRDAGGSRPASDALRPTVASPGGSDEACGQSS